MAVVPVRIAASAPHITQYQASASSPGPVLTPSSPTPLDDFDSTTAETLERLHRAWATHAPVSDYAAIRDAILRQREQVDTRIFTLIAVAQLACPADVLADPLWNELVALSNQTVSNDRASSTCESHSSHGEGPAIPDPKRRRRVYNESNRLRNLAFVAALWSPSLVAYYRWNDATQVQMNTLRACATRYPRFHLQFRPRLNRVLLHRHCQALQTGRCKTLNEAPLQPHRDLDLAALAAAVPDPDLEAQWTSNQDGCLSIDDTGTLLRDIRPAHFRMHLLSYDRYGILVSRNDDATPLHYDMSSELHGPAFLSHVEDTDNFGTFSAPFGPASLPISADADYFLNQGYVAPSPAIIAPFTDAPSTVNLPAQPNIISSEQPHEQACAYEQFALGSNFDFDVDTLVNFHGWHTSSWRRQGSYDPSLQSILQQPNVSTHFFDGSPLATIPDTPFPLDRVPEAPVMTVGSPLMSLHCGSTFEAQLHTKYYDLITFYNNLIVNEAMAPGASAQLKARAQWLPSCTRWATIWTDSDSQLSRGRAKSCDDADIIVIGSNELMTALQRNHVFRKPVVVKEVFSDSHLHSMDSFALLLRHALAESRLDMSAVNTNQSSPLSVDDIVNSMHKSDDRGELGCTLKLREITRSHQPLLTMLPRFRLLDSLIERTRGGDPTKPAADSIPSWVRSNTLGLKGAFIGAQFSTGTWMRNLSGVHFWTMIPASATDWGDLSLGKGEWSPQGRQKFFILEQNDVLFIPPGVCVLHALHSPTDVLSEGGTLLDSSNLVHSLDSVYRMLNCQPDRHGDVLHQLPRLLVELESLVKHRMDEFQGESSKEEFMTAFKEVVSRLSSLRCAFPRRPCDHCQTCSM